MSKSYVIAQYNHIDGTLDIQVYDDCQDEKDALLSFAEDEGYHDIPDVENMDNSSALDVILDWFDDMDLTTQVKEL